MNQHEHYISGPHRYWVHFFAGLALGALLGWWVLGDLFERAMLNVLSVTGTAVCLALFCGRWGEPGWRRVSDWLAWWFGTLR